MPAEAVPAELDVFGVLSVTDVTLQQAAGRIAARDPAAPFAFIVTPNAAHATELARPDSVLRPIYAAAWMRLCDGQALRVLGRVLFKQSLPLAAGSDLTLLLLRSVLRPEDTVAVVGGDPALAAALRARFDLPRLVLHQPPMGFIHDPAAVAAAVRFVLDHPARLLFVATGSPQSERLLMEVARTGRASGIGISVGSSLQFATGRVRRAPAAMRRAGLEWLFRLAINPRGHARRVFVDSLPVVALAVRRRLRG